MTYDWTGAGGSGDYFGTADYDRALRSGKSIQDVRDYIANNPGSIRQGSQAVADLVETINTGRLTSNLGQGEGAGGGLTEQAKTHFGGTDYLHARAAGHSNIAISDYMKDSPMSIGAASDLGFVHTRAGEDREAAEREAERGRAAQWRNEESERRRLEAEARYKKMVEAQEAAAEAARKEALKVKHTGSTSVGAGQSAMGIKFAQSPAFASGAASRGTAQLARSDKGTKLTNMNIA